MNFASFTVDGPKGCNQDRVLDPVAFYNGWIAAVADGVGGNPGGEIAAEAAIAALRSGAAQGESSFNNMFLSACERIKKAGAVSPDLARMATTLSAVRVQGGVAYTAHVGDSRIYHMRNSGIITRTEDQTEVAHLLREKVITPSQARNYSRKNVITSFLSSSSKFDLHQTTFNVADGDFIVILTDGAYSMVKKSEIVDGLLMATSLNQFAKRLGEQLRHAGVRDDSTLIAIEI